MSDLNSNDKRPRAEVEEPIRRTLSVKETARAIGISKASLYSLWRKGLGPPRRRVQGRVLILISELESWFASQKIIDV